MTKFILFLNSSTFSFLSGIYVSISMSAFSNLVFAAVAPANASALLRSSLITLLAGIAWFVLSGIVAAAKGQVDRQLQLEMSFEEAISNVATSRKAFIVILFVVAVFLSGVWIVWS